MKIDFTENDILQYASEEEKMVLEGESSSDTLGPEMTIPRILVRVLSKSLASLGRNMADEHLALNQMTVKLEIEGKPFNVGLGGSVEYVFNMR